MSDNNGSAEQQAERMEERAAEERARRRTRDGERYGMTGGEARGRATRRFARGVVESPVAPLIVGLALLGGIAAILVMRDDRAVPGLRLLGRRSRGLAEAFREPDLALQPRVLGTLARLAALGLAGVTWRWVRAIARDPVV
jgi:hypothetical protein